jgi:hypothetical protein
MEGETRQERNITFPKFANQESFVSGTKVFTEFSLGSVLVGDPEGPGDESELAEVSLQFGVVDAVLQSSDEHRFGLTASL